MMQTKLFSLGMAAIFALAACSDDSDPTPQPDKGVVVDQGVKDDGQKTPDQAGDQASKGKVEDYVPQDGVVDGWQRDGALETAYTSTDMFDLIDGSQEDFVGALGLARQSYAKGDLKMVLTMWEMKTAADAKSLFDKYAADPDLTFESIEVKDAASIADATPQWEVIGHKGPYYYKIFGTFTTMENKPTLKADVIAFVKKLAGILP